jgi:hypothetical protein
LLDIRYCEIAWSLFILTVTAECLTFASWTLLKVARQMMEKSGQYATIGTMIFYAIPLTLLIATWYAVEIASANAEAFNCLGMLKFRTLEVFLFHGV